MSRFRILPLFLLLFLCAVLSAQESKPVRLLGSNFDHDDEVLLSLPWRYTPAAADGLEAPAVDDARWQSIPPALEGADCAGWNGAGWFRRHLIVSPALQSRTLALRLSAPGTAEVYLDGAMVLSTARNLAAQEIPGSHSDAVLIALKGPSHVLAVRYRYPVSAIRPGGGIGFALALGNRPQTGVNGAPRTWLTGLEGAVTALPFFLALLHFALFFSDRRARENLYYALEMLTFSVLVLREFRSTLLPFARIADVVGRSGDVLPIVGILFGGLTYYALRTRPYPRSWRWFAGLSVPLVALAFFIPSTAEYCWMGYFVLLICLVFRVEHTKQVIRRDGVVFFMTSLVVFCISIVLQILINFGVLESIGGVHEAYIFGILATAVGMSLYLGSTLRRSRINESENASKSVELGQARELQLSMLPKTMPVIAGIDVAAVSTTAAEVGGDFYDVRESTDATVMLAFGDATGHGLSAGIVVTAAKALFASIEGGESVSEQLMRCDRAMMRMQLRSLRMCLALARVTRSSIELASAAMPPVLIHRAASGLIEELGTGGLPLGTRIRAVYQTEPAALHSGDTILFASDGFAELFDEQGSQLGYEGVEAAFRAACQAGTAHDVIIHLEGSVDRFRGDRSQDDDITFLVVRIG